MNRAEYDKQFAQFTDLSAKAGRMLPDPKQQVVVLDEDGKSHTERDYSPVYLAHCAWAARMLAKYPPQFHVDFGSYVYFAAICAAFIPRVRFCDIRALGTPIPGLELQITDLTAIAIESSRLESVSCLHVLEHCGLARYGDKLDPRADSKAASELKRVLRLGGKLLMVLPMNETPRINFNAHRYYSQLDVDLLFSGMRVIEKCLFDPAGREASKVSGDYTGCFVMEKQFS